jgi:Hemagglutinin repeat
VGASFTVSAGVAGVSASMGVSAGSSSSRSDSAATSNSNSLLEAGGTLRLNSGGDTSLVGVQAAGRDVALNVGGDFRLASAVDQQNNSSDSSGINVGASLSASSAGNSSNVSTSRGGSVGLSSGSATASAAQVAVQSSLLARGGSLVAQVAGDTTLAGAVLAAVDGNGKDSGALRLVTGSLSLTDIAEHDTSSSTQIGVGLSTGSSSKGDTSAISGSDRRGALPAGLSGTLDLATSSTAIEAHTKAAIGHGSITLTASPANDNGTTTTDLASLNRDITATRLITKDARSGLVLQADSAAITDSIALGKDIAHATCTSTACTTAQSAIANPLGVAKNVIAEAKAVLDANSRAPLDSATETLLETVRALTGTTNTSKLGGDLVSQSVDDIQVLVGKEVTLKDGQKHIFTQAEADAAKAHVKNAKPEDVGTATGLALKVNGDGGQLLKPTSDKPEAKDKPASEDIVVTAHRKLTEDGRSFGNSVVNVTTDLHQGYESQSKPVQFLIDVAINGALGTARPVVGTLAGYGVGAAIKYWPSDAGGGAVREALGNLNRSVGAVAASGLTDDSYQGVVQDYTDGDKTTIRQTDALAWGTTTLLGDSFVKSVSFGLKGLAGGIGAAGVSLNALRGTDNAAGGATKADVPKPDAPKMEGVDPSNRASFEVYKDELRANMSKPEVSDAGLANIVDKLYRQDASIGSGSTAAAVREELLTSQPTKGRYHSAKATESIAALNSWLKANVTARSSDRAAAENLIRDMQNALKGN